MGEIYDPKTFEPRKAIGYLMSKARMALLDAVERELAPLEITAAQFIILTHLANSMASSASEMCRGMQYDPGAMTRMIDRLEQKELVRRIAIPGDRRTVKLELTDEGRSVYSKVKPMAVGVLNRLLRGFNKKEVRELEEYLKRIIANG